MPEPVPRSRQSHDRVGHFSGDRRSGLGHDSLVAPARPVTTRPWNGSSGCCIHRDAHQRNQAIRRGARVARGRTDRHQNSAHPVPAPGRLRQVGAQRARGGADQRMRSWAIRAAMAWSFGIHPWAISAARHPHSMIDSRSHGSSVSMPYERRRTKSTRIASRQGGPESLSIVVDERSHSGGDGPVLGVGVGRSDRRVAPLL